MKKLKWGPWRLWDATTALYPPADAPPGAFIEADLVTRADWIGRPFKSGAPRPAVTRHTFTVRTGETFILNPPWDVMTSHLVIRYRVWCGTPDEYEGHEAEEMLELLQPDAQRQHKIDYGVVEEQL